MPGSFFMSNSYKWDRKEREGADYQRETFTRVHDQNKKEYDLQKDRNDLWNTGARKLPSTRPLRFFETITDPALGVFASNAREQARHAYRTLGLRSWHHHYTIDIADVTIDLRGRSVFIKIIPLDQFEFEFMTSGYPVVTQAVAQDGVGFLAYRGLCIGVSVSALHGVVTARSRVRLRRRTAVSRAGDDISQIGRGYMVGMLSEPVVLPDARIAFSRWRYPRNLFESWAPHHGHTGVHWRDTQRAENNNPNLVVPQPNPGGLLQHSLRDAGIDVPYEDNTSRDVLRAAYIRGVADWPRADGLQKVTDNTYGTHEFAIYVDAFNVFNIFPTAAIGPLIPGNPYGQNVDELYVQRKTLTFGGWVYRPTTKLKDYFSVIPPSITTADQALMDFPEIDWKFNHLGTKAAAVVYEREDFTNDTTYWAAEQGPTPFTGTDFTNLTQTMGVGSRHNLGKSVGYNETRHFVATGILEVTISITITGPNLEDYNATVNVVEKRRPTTATRCALAVGYVWHDCFTNNKDAAGNRIKLASAGDFVTLDVERWGSGAQFPASYGQDEESYALSRRANILSLRNVDTDQEYLSLKSAQVLGVDFNTLSFAFMANILSEKNHGVYPTKAGYTPANPTTKQDMYRYDFAVMIVHSGLIKDFIFPETMEPQRRDAIIAKYAESGRTYVNAKALETPAWMYVPLQGSTGMDGWSDTGINNYRRWWAYNNGYKTLSTGAYDANIEGKIFGLWGQEMGDDNHMFVCTSPRWGWSCYSSVICSHMMMNAGHTFYAHPNGTWTFYSDSFIYDNQMIQPSGGLALIVNTIDSYDPTKLEHVIFDKIHFEMRLASGGALGKADHSFVGLYNKAVRSALAAQKLEENIFPIERANQIATFTTEAVDWGTPINGLTYLKVVATWGSKVWRYTEHGVQGGTYYNVLLPVQGGLIGLNFDYANWEESVTTELQTPSYSTELLHIRFCDPIVLSKVR